MHSILDRLYSYNLSNDYIINETDICPICLEKVSTDTKSMRIPCHSVCVNCADAWLQIKKQCPMCRSPDVDKIKNKISESNKIIGYKLTQGLLNMVSCLEEKHNLSIDKHHGIIVVTCYTCLHAPVVFLHGGFF